jgi:hypothetical protein
MILGEFDCSKGVINILYSHQDIIVRTSTLKDMLLIDKLQKENSNAVGFIQKTAITSGTPNPYGAVHAESQVQSQKLKMKEKILGREL